MPDSRMVRSTVGCPFDDLVMRGFAVAYAFGVQERRRRTSRGRGRRPRPLCHGVSTARGSGVSIRRHTSCSWASSDPWCGTLNTDACPDGRSRLARIRFQPCRATSGPEERDFEFVVAGRPIGPCHGRNARAVSAAHTSASFKSVDVMAGRSRNTICDTRFLVPVTERS